MLKFFRSSQISAAVVVILIGIGLWLKSILQIDNRPFLFDTVNMPFYSYALQLLPNNAIVSRLITFLLVLFAGFYLLRINNHFVLNKQRSYMLPLVLILISSAFYPLQRLNPAVFASFFLVLSIYNIFAIYQKKDALDNIFRASISLGIAYLFYSPMLMVFLILFLGLLLLRSINIREWIVALVGLLLPVLLYLFAMFFIGTSIHEVFELFKLNLCVHSLSTMPTTIPLAFLVCVGIPFIWSLLYLASNMGAQKNSVRKYQTLNFWLLVFVVIAFVAIPNASYELIYLAAIPLSFIFTNLFMNVNVNFISRILFLLLLVGAIIGQFLN